MKKFIYKLSVLLLAVVCVFGSTACGDSSTGKDGITPHIVDGYWYIGDNNTGIPVTGPPGETGNGGITPHIGVNGNWYIGNLDTGISVTGPPGESGSEGITPHIGTDGNWHIGDFNTGIPAQGPPGSSIGDVGLSAYELYIEYNPEYTGSEEQWLDDLINGRLGQEAVPHIIFNQIYGGGDRDSTPFTHNFIELYNPTNEAVSLAGWTLVYSTNRSGTRFGGPNGDAAPYTSPVTYTLTGTIPARTSYLIRGFEERFPNDDRAALVKYNLDDIYDIYFPHLIIENDANIHLELFNQNNKRVDAFSNRTGSPLEGDIPAANSKQRSYRRVDFVDTDNNFNDFVQLVWNVDAADAAFIALYRPRSLADGAWENEKQPDPTRPNYLIILQTFGGGGQADTAISHSFIELYNPTDTPISLAGYSIKYSSTGTSAKGSETYWSSVSDTVASGVLEFNLPVGHTIPANTSYLIRGVVELGTPPDSAVPTISVFDFDIGDRALDNRDYKVELVKDGVEIINVMHVTHQNNKHTTARRVDFMAEGYQLYFYSGSTGQGAIQKTASDWVGTGATDINALRPRSLVDGQWGF